MMSTNLRSMMAGAVALLAFATVSAPAQEAPAPESGTGLIYFDEPVGFKEFFKTTVYAAWKNRKSFFLLPTAVRDLPNDTISLHYQNKGGRLSGTLILSIQPAFDTAEFEAITAELKSGNPDGRFVVVEPLSSEWELLGYGARMSLTPVLMSNPLLSSTSITVAVPEQMIKALLHQGSHYAGVFVIRHKFAVKGVELDRDFQPRITTRWFSRGVSLTGTCDVFPERFINIDSGATGCVYQVVARRESVADVQAMLKELTLYKGAVDGVLGTQTRRAIRQFQQDVGMRQDGVISSVLVAKLREAVSKQG